MKVFELRTRPIQDTRVIERVQPAHNPLFPTPDKVLKVLRRQEPMPRHVSHNIKIALGRLI